MELEADARLDLGAVEESRRAATWARSAELFFPGLSIDLKDVPQGGNICGIPFGPGTLWAIKSPPVVASYRPIRLTRESDCTFSVMLQMDEYTSVSQNGHSCRLSAQQFCLLDGNYPFELEVSSPSSHFMFLQIPRHAVLGPYAYLKQCTATPFGSDDCGSDLVRVMLFNLLQSAHALAPDQRGVALGAIARLLGIAKQRPGHGDVGWRVRCALAHIDANLADPELTADQVASQQKISRRRLDDIMQNAIGTSVTAQIWNRRLAQVAADLHDARNASKTIAQLAFEAGFKDPAHFARAFKKRYGETPNEWRSKPKRAGDAEGSDPG